MGETITVASVMGDIVTMGTSMWTMATAAMGFVTSNALAFVSFTIGFIGLGIGAINRLLKR